MKRAAVLGSGGVVGTAWLTGIMEGLREAGVDLTAADTLVGTSAGSITCARLTTQPRADAPAAPSTPPHRSALVGSLDQESAREIFMTWASLEGPDPKVAARIGELTRRATADGEQLVQMYAGALGDPEWPARDLRVVSTDAVTGERVVHRAGGGVRLARAVAASAAVPGIFPPVPVGDGFQMDGAVHSTTNADLLLGEGFECVVVAMPTCELTARRLGVLAERCMQAEVAALRDAGVRVEVLAPEERDREAYGQGLMDASHAPQAQDAGRAQAAREAERIAKLWNG